MNSAERRAVWLQANPDRKAEYKRRENVKLRHKRRAARGNIWCLHCQAPIPDAKNSLRQYCGKSCIEKASRARIAALKPKPKPKRKVKVKVKLKLKSKRLPEKVLKKQPRPPLEPIRLELAEPQTWLSRRLRSRF